MDPQSTVTPQYHPLGYFGTFTVNNAIRKHSKESEDSPYFAYFSVTNKKTGKLHFYCTSETESDAIFGGFDKTAPSVSLEPCKLFPIYLNQESHLKVMNGNMFACMLEEENIGLIEPTVNPGWAKHPVTEEPIFRYIVSLQNPIEKRKIPLIVKFERLSKICFDIKKTTNISITN
jgi:hypothetical protein